MDSDRPPRKPVLPLPLSLRPATEDDLARVVLVERQAHPNPWTEEHFRSEMEKPYCRFWVLTDDETDEVVFGFVVFWVMGEDSEILDIVVDPQNRRQGLARFILQKTVAEAMSEGAKRMILNVRKSNEAAVQLYQAAGFMIRHIRERFYSDGESSYAMELPLEGKRLDF